MATGDLKNNLRKLQRLLRQVSYKEEVDYDGMSKGLPNSFLPIYHYVLTSFSRHLATRLNETDIHLTGATDLKFVELMYRVLRDVFGYKPKVPKEKFFSAGFAERKVIMCTEVITEIQKLHLKHEPRKPTQLSKSILTNTTAKPERPKSAPAQPSMARREPRGPYEPTAYCPTASSIISQSMSSHSATTKQTTSVPVVIQAQHIERQTLPPDVVQSEVLPMAAAVAAHTPLSQKSVVKVAPVTKSVVSFAEQTEDLEFPVVEVVRMNDMSQSINDQHLRPIDIVAQTPGRPALREAATLDQIVQKLDSLVNRVTTIDERLALVETELGSQHTNRVPDMPQDTNQIQTILARLTLIESRMKSTDAKLLSLSQGGSRMISVPGPTAQEWTATVLAQRSPPPIVQIEHSIPSTVAKVVRENDAVAALNRPSHINQGQAFDGVAGSVNGNSRDIFTADCQPDRHPAVAEASEEEPLMPSPIVSDLIRQVVRESCSEASDETPRVSTPTDNASVAHDAVTATDSTEDSFSAVFTSLSNDRLQQAKRIQSMMLETKDKLTM